jgi:hypothetical protein
MAGVGYFKLGRRKEEGGVSRCMAEIQREKRKEVSYVHTIQ